MFTTMACCRDNELSKSVTLCRSEIRSLALITSVVASRESFDIPIAQAFDKENSRA